MRPGHMEDMSDIARKAVTPAVEVTKPLSRRPEREPEKELARRPDAVVRREAAKETSAPVARGRDGTLPQQAIASQSMPNRASVKQLPPTASPVAREKFEEVMKKVLAKRQEKVEIQQKQAEKWSSRPQVLKTWEAQDERHRQRFAAMLARQEAEARKDEEKRAAILARSANTPQAEEARRKQLESLDRQIAEKRIKEASERAQAEEAHARNIAKREKWQRTKDKVFNTFGRFLGWEKRQTPSLDGWNRRLGGGEDFYSRQYLDNFGSYEYLGNSFRGHRLGSFEPE